MSSTGLEFRITETARRYRRLSHRLRMLNAAAARIKQKMDDIETKDLVELFNEAETRSTTTTDGIRLERGLTYAAHWPKPGPARDAAIAWLTAHEHTDVIKCEIVANWAMGDEAKAKAAYQILRGDNSASVSLDQFVHPMTLAKLARELVAAQRLALAHDTGADAPAPPFETLGVTLLDKVKVKLPSEEEQ